MDIIRELEKDLMKKDVTDFKVGDTVRVAVKIKEGDKTRNQAFEGIVIARKGSGMKETFTVRHISFGEGVERVFLIHSPQIDSIKVVKKGKVNRARLYYLRKRVGKSTSVEEERDVVKGQTNAGLGEKSAA
ncbi:MAG: 50S ribosomal protein L19 [Candidatus Omnitrophica bacterium CG_4_9_14_0_2_um_filter_42_8]|nr:MAG: 50S ribosomal protein L19 [Candidatus Omnitrophica bacterium CG22_combo_CG10-13_8_21_14_all_43_16]PJC48293.1 MAG: 50S ribosomal protein L19 [Candidatus Omnitrophica bacterium CG_4_9_14_0_2_um_filter_42_8]